MPTRVPHVFGTTTVLVIFLPTLVDSQYQLSDIQHEAVALPCLSLTATSVSRRNRAALRALGSSGILIR
jgi:hypothetical protein